MYLNRDMETIVDENNIKKENQAEEVDLKPIFKQVSLSKHIFYTSLQGQTQKDPCRPEFILHKPN